MQNIIDTHRMYPFNHYTVYSACITRHIGEKKMFISPNRYTATWRRAIGLIKCSAQDLFVRLFPRGCDKMKGAPIISATAISCLISLAHTNATRRHYIHLYTVLLFIILYIFEFFFYLFRNSEVENIFTGPLIV